ncbi:MULTISPECIES: type II toxin-antitoxin system death-on-curing family toxin [unclassified Streptomyces]|uniref:type II toxin-antitoxin system death-on-curing family toxin n=1 Tax=unclassified Streptomyces TaxID=2593676 RepID=UPI00278BD800|nr:MULTISPECIES: Fic family protein [unclassified Streptomyces]
MTVRYLQLDEVLLVVRGVTGSEHAVRDIGLLVSAVERPRTDVFGTEVYPSVHEKAAALLQSLARNHALVDGNERTAWLCCRVFLRFNGLAPDAAVPAATVAGPFVEDVAVGDIGVATIAKRLALWFPLNH